MKKSAGIVFTYQNKILLVHPSSAPWFNSYGFPKGLLEGNESIIEAAIRETQEEIGVVCDKSLLTTVDSIKYLKGTNCYKINYYCHVKLQSLSDIGLTTEIIPREQLQLSEVDWAGFLDLNEAKKRIFHRQIDLLKLLK